MKHPADLGAGAALTALAAGDVTAVELTRALLERISTIDGELRSFVRLDPTAEQQAAEADRRRQSGQARPLIPSAVTDSITGAETASLASEIKLIGFDLIALIFCFCTGFTEDFARRTNRQLEGNCVLHVFANKDGSIDAVKLNVFTAGGFHHGCDHGFIRY